MTNDAAPASLHKVWIPSLHRDLTGGLDVIELAAATLGEVLDQLDARFPGLKARLSVDDRLRPGIAVVVNGAIAQRGLYQRLPAGSELHFVRAISGG